MKAVIYARYSSSAQRAASIPEQIKTCQEYADRNNYTIVDIYKDMALTGTNDKRPALQKLLKDCSKKQFDAVIVYSIDRFGRNLRQSLENADKIESVNGISLISVTEQFTNDPSGRFFRNIMMSYAQYYSDELSVKIKRGMDYNAEKCLCTGGNIALGFKVDQNKHFQIDPETAPIVKKIFEMYAEGKTVTQIAAYLNAQGIKTSRGIPFNKNSLHTMLKNKRYIGVYTYKGKETPGGMPHIISDELFNKVAERMEKNRKAPARSRAKIEYLLTTKLFCGYCKEMMTGYSATGKHGKTYYYYICNGKKQKNCSKKMVKKDYIENLVISQCKTLLSKENIEKIANAVVAKCEEEKDTTNLKYLKKRLSDNERKHKNTIDAIMECDIESLRKTLYDKIPILEKENEELKKQIAKESAVLPQLTVPKIKFFLTSLKNGNIDDIKYKKTLISIFVNRIYLYDDRITITFNSGNETVTINDLLLSEIEENNQQVKNLFMAGNGPPERLHKIDAATKNLDFIEVFCYI